MKLFIAQLDYAINSSMLQTAFEDHGNVVSCKVVDDHITGRSRGFAFVEMGSEEEGLNAIEQMHGKSFRGREIVVRKAEEKRRS